MYMAQEEEDEDKESPFLMVIADEHADVLLQGISGSPVDDVVSRHETKQPYDWYEDFLSVP